MLKVREMDFTTDRVLLGRDLDTMEKVRCSSSRFL